MDIELYLVYDYFKLFKKWFDTIEKLIEEIEGTEKLPPDYKSAIIQMINNKKEDTKQVTFLADDIKLNIVFK